MTDITERWLEATLPGDVTLTSGFLCVSLVNFLGYSTGTISNITWTLQASLDDKGLNPTIGCRMTGGQVFLGLPSCRTQDEWKTFYRKIVGADWEAGYMENP